MSAPDHELGKELHATVQARKDLGPEYESELIDSFLEKAAQRLDAQVENRVRRELAQQQTAGARVATRGGYPGRPRDQDNEFRHRGFGLAIVSMVLAIPLSAIAVVNAHLPGLLISWGGIVAVNVAHSLSNSRDRRNAPGRSAGPASEWD
jgi:hypothetical protein